jgi:ferredoxin
MPARWAITTSRRQGQTREGMSEGSPSANVRADEQKPYRRLSLWASQHKMTKPTRCKGQGKCGGCARKVHVLIRGDLSHERYVSLW